MLSLSPRWAFLLVSFCLGELGDGLNIFQGIYLVGIGWNEGSVGTALSIMGLTALLVQPLAGDWVDRTTVDRRLFLTAAAIITALSASSILFVNNNSNSKNSDSNTFDHALIYGSKIIEGVASSFIGPCLAALTLAHTGPQQFDNLMADNILWGHVGSVVAAILAGTVAYGLYPHIRACFLVIGLSALGAVAVCPSLPLGNPLLGRGLAVAEKDDANEKYNNNISTPQVASYREVFSDFKTCIVCATGFFFHFANANVLLVLGELMGQSSSDDNDGPSRNAIPLIAGAIVTAQATMAAATYAGDQLTLLGIGRKPLYMAGLATLPVRCALIILLRQAGDGWLLSTQILDGLGGGLCGLIHPLIVADIAFGTGRFNVLMGLTASSFGLGATLSNFVGQWVVERFGHVASLSGSFFLSFAPLLLFATMPETRGLRAVAEAQASAAAAAPPATYPKNLHSPRTADGYVTMV